MREIRLRRWAVALALGAGALLVLPGAGPLPLLVALLAFLSALGLGLVLLRADPSLEPGPRLLVATALGGGLLAQIFHLLLMASAWPRWTGPLLLALPGVALFLPVTLPAFRRAMAGEPRTSASWWWPLFAAGTFWGGLLLITASTPPIDYDSLVYHLALPEQWLLRGGSVLEPGFHYSAFPLAAESAFAAAMAVGGTVSAKILAWTFLPLCAGAVWLLARRLEPGEGRGGGPAVAAVAFATLPVVAITATLTYNDLWTAAFLILSLEALMRRAETSHPAPALEAGALAGLALASKYLALAALPALAAAALLMAGLGRQWNRAVWRDAGLASGAAVLVAFPAYLRNLIALGNPVYPAAWRTLGGGVWDEVSIRGAADAKHHAGTLAGLVGIPIDLWRDPFRFGAGADPGPLLLLALPAAILVLFARGPGRRFRLAAGLCFLLMFLAWWATAMNGRYLLAGMGILCALAAGAVSESVRPQAVRVAALLLLAVGVILGADRAVGFQTRVVLSRAGPYLKGLESAQEYVVRRSPLREFYQKAQAFLPEDATVLLVGEARRLGLERRAIASAAYDPAPLSLIGAGAGDIRSTGATHVLVHAAEAERLDREYGHFRQLGGGRWKEILRGAGLGQPLLVDPIRGFYLFQVPPRPPGG